MGVIAGGNLKTVVFVILYDKSITDSKSLTSLALSEIDRNTSELVVINNGPKQISSDLDFLSHCFSQVHFEEFLENLPLSKLYNNLLSKYNNNDRFIIFDDDTLIPIDFFTDLNESYSFDIDLQLPKIISIEDGNCYYPLVNGLVESSCQTKKYTEEDIVYSIGSGMTIHKSLIDKFHAHGMNIFDESFALYGVDMSIFKAMNLLKEKENESFKIQLASHLKHSLSRVSSKKSVFRERERIYDSLLSSIIYPEYKSQKVKMILKSFYLCLIKLDLFCFVNVIKIIFRKKHPRC